SPPVSCIITSFMIPDHPSPAQAQIRLPAVDNSPLFVTRSQTEWLEISPKTCGTTFPCVTPCSGERDRDGDFHPTAVPPPPMDSATSFAGHIAISSRALHAVRAHATTAVPIRARVPDPSPLSHFRAGFLTATCTSCSAGASNLPRVHTHQRTHGISPWAPEPRASTVRGKRDT